MFVVSGTSASVSYLEALLAVVTAVTAKSHLVRANGANASRVAAAGAIEIRLRRKLLSTKVLLFNIIFKRISSSFTHTLR